jgi:peptidoglycan/LPS O-acetylase OafA/YrhL
MPEVDRVDAPAPPRSRLSALDGLRGLAILLVVLSHGWQLWPIEWIDEHALIRPLFRSGNFAVTIFLVAAGYLSYVGLASRGLPRMRPGVALVRRVLRVGPSLWLMLAVILVVSTLDSTDRTDKGDNVDSVLHVLTYTWNWYVQENLVTSRPDFGHLWYLSVDMQAFVVMALFLYALRRRPVGVLFALAGLLALLTWWRFHVTDTEFVFQVLVRTTARMDPFVVGVMLGAALPLIRRLSPPDRVLRPVATSTLALLVPLMWFCSRDERFLGWGVTLLELDLAVLIGAMVLLQRAPRSLNAVSHPWLAFLGRHSLLLYIWHYPVFVFVERHTEDWGWPARTVVGLLATAIVSLVSYRLVERRAAALLRHPEWEKTEDGLLTYLVRTVRQHVGSGARETAGDRR